MFVDSHCHIDIADYDLDRDEVLARAVAVGVETILVVGTGDPHRGETERAINLADDAHRTVAQKIAPRVYATVGIHPHDARLLDDRIAARLDELLRTRERLVALGEIGLDYHYDHSPRDVQRKVFARQLRMARELNLPVVIHTREADEDTMAILEAEMDGYEREGGCGVMHCFGGDMEAAERALRLGFLISFAGNLTFRKAEELRAVARAIPLDHLLIETDAPYLAPAPHRGRRNEPAHVVEVARTLALLHDADIEMIAHHTTANFHRLFHTAQDVANFKS